MAIENHDNEDALESAVMDLFQPLGYEVGNAHDEISCVNHFGRVTLDEVVLLSGLYPALQCLNPGVPQYVSETAFETLLTDRSLFMAANANVQVCSLLKNGVKVTFYSLLESHSWFRTSLRTLLNYRHCFVGRIHNVV